ncbi:MAG: hypothetical protein KAW12_10155 [Candidatus Aminicenantes bacterium]|nr:hypothetical protein [Candidatus Aminicenantes bacterium]
MGGIENKTPAGELAILNSDHLAAGRPKKRIAPAAANTHSLTTDQTAAAPNGYPNPKTHKPKNI